MKKIILLALFAVALFSACDPIEDRLDMGSAITVDEIKATVTLIQENGKNVNYVKCDCSSPVSCKWSNGVLSKSSSYAEMLMFLPGEQTVTLYALCPDGTMLTKEYTVNVEVMSDNYPVPVQYSYLCGDGEKVWVWDNYTGILSDDGSETSPFGNGGYMGNIGPGWWKVGMSELDKTATDNASTGDGKDAYMTFRLNGMELEKSSGAKGTFDFDMSAIVAEGWDIGKFTTTGVNVLIGVNPNASAAPFYDYSILKLDDDVLWLGAPSPGAGSWGEGWFWCFRKEGTVPQ